MDYTTLENVKSYSDTSASKNDALIETAIKAVSRAMDGYCRQKFGYQQYSQERLRGAIDRDGCLMVAPAVPFVENISSIEWKPTNSATWSSITLSAAEPDCRDSGSFVRFVGIDLSRYRSSSIVVRMSYWGGWQEQELPEDFEWVARRWTWLELKRREAPIEKSAIPELGVVVIPSNLPPDIRDKLNVYKRTVML